jgi:signal peptidase II
LSVRSRSLVLTAVTLAVVIALDQITKAIIRSSVPLGTQEGVGIGIKIVNVDNTGVAFSQFAGGGWIVTAVSIVALLALIVFFFAHLRRPLIWLPTGLMIGGAAGNLIDRLARGAVTDFIKLPYWPAFNIADSAITIGIIILIYVLEGPPRRRERQLGASSTKQDLDEDCVETREPSKRH